MARPDFYVVLGVRRDETPERIREAYRRLAKRHHPDRAGGASTARFQQISEAYRTLSDPDARRAYDDDRGAVAAASPLAPEPLGLEPLELFDAAARYRPSFEDLQERYLRNFLDGWAPKAETVEGLNVEIVLSHEEAQRGLVLPIEVPTLQECEACDGTGDAWMFPCTACRRLGRVLVPRTVHLHLRAPVVPGAVHEIPLDRLGVHNFVLRVHTAVE
jgi:DnaJ-class molecular chaperone